MKYRTIGTDPATRREVSVLALGAMLFGSVTDEKTSFAILDHFVEVAAPSSTPPTTTRTGSGAVSAARASGCSGSGGAAAASATR